MNEEAVRALKEAMEPPSWWPNAGRLKPREVLGRLEELGYTVARTSQTGAAPVSGGSGSAGRDSGQQVDGNRLADLMTDLEANVAAVKESRHAEQPIRREQRESA